MTRIRTLLTRRAFAAAFVLASLAAVSAPAAAQFGSILNKVKEKAVEKATGAEDQASPRLQGTELTDEQINKLFKGLALVASKLEARDKLAEREQKLSTEASSLLEKHRVEIAANENGRGAWWDCFGNQWAKLQKLRDGEMQSRMMKAMSNPATAQKVAQLQMVAQQDMQKAMAAGDTGAVHRATRKMQQLQMEMLGIDLKKDSATARAPCGAEPPRLAVAIEIDTLTARSTKLGEEMRDLERTAQAQGAMAAGMNGTDFALSREKVGAFASSGNGGRLLTREELERLRGRKAEIEKLKRAL